MSIFHPTPTSLATAIHTTLTQSCAPTPLDNHKSGEFATTITPAVPVLTCLHHLSTSPHSTPSERAVFASTHTRLAFLLAQEAARVPISNTQLLLNALMLDDLAAVFNADRRSRSRSGHDSFSDSDAVSASVPSIDETTPAPDDTVSTLLHITTTTLRAACETFRGGVLRTRLSGPKQLLVALEGLSRDVRLDADERAVFARAKAEAGALYALQRQGVRGSGDMYAAHWAWWALVVGVLERDAARRGIGGGWRGYERGWMEGDAVGEEGERKGEEGLGTGSFARALAGGEWPVRGDERRLEGIVGWESVGSKRASETGSVGASFRKRVKGAFT
ncbi:hypothetical protein MMC11_003932 [Xylographa trunciseda]|nr:hypothetical protein [Xylographa trunciseda]